MAKPDSKKKTPGNRNPDRRNGKAWKKAKDGVPTAPQNRMKPRPRVRTPERQEKDLLIKERRELNRQLGMARKAEERRLALEQAELEAAIAAEKKAMEEAMEEAERKEKHRQDPAGVAKRVHKQRVNEPRPPRSQKPKVNPNARALAELFVFGMVEVNY